ncbi:GNAT family N-acetyltransferase [Mangrovimonas sp. CR14]|uniref:GNAT family N-acetyltransferase n=1 Tax=Mangrovimonas sp. CR14 TaxID=2706120 RepID=UPI00142166D1|nr:GNAT family N-acetyltransferase [Mangrovimonas sp. CR14]NIK92853.1 GNAT family N-acetyltransferase [Mangrovimonas sp. CR14]
MKFFRRSILSESEKLEIFELWNNEYPEKLSYQSKEEFDKYLENLREQSHLLIIDANQKIKGWYFDFKRDNEKWFAIILDSNIQGNGLGTKILELAKQKENELNGWVIDHNRDKKKNGKVYNSPLNFYLKNGFEKLAANRLELDKISAVKIKWKK